VSWDIEQSTEELAGAVDRYDEDAASDLCDELVTYLRGSDQPYPTDQAKRVLGLLRKKRYFHLMQQVADVLLQTGQESPVVLKLYAQSQIDQGNLTAAMGTLHRLKSETDDDPNEQEENAEARGLLGRAYKQLYVNADKPENPRNQDHIRRSIEFYHDVYLSNRNKRYWQGINCVALLQRAAVDGVYLPGFPDPRSTADGYAADILEVVSGLWDPDRPKDDDTWVCATAVEANIALKDYRQAIGWLTRYLGTKYADAFELESTHRQLQEVWRLTAAAPPGDRILPPLAGRLLGSRDGQIEVSAKNINQLVLEKVADDPEYRTSLGGYFEDYQWFVNAVKRGRGVGSVYDGGDEHRATGFLVRGVDLSESLSGQVLFMTNAHVISVDERDAEFTRTVAPDEAIIKFDPDRKDEGIRVTDIVWTSYVDELDVTIVRLEGAPPGTEPFPIAKDLPDPNAEKKERVYIIGHPIGRPTLSYSMNDNEYIGHSDQYIYYRTRTSKRSSGSPVFNSKWELIGVHHYGLREVRLAGSEDLSLRANEGTSIQAVRSLINST
jgi:V8-like Glu-specific endopeptidase